PVRGRLIAISLRSDKGLPLGILIAVRMIEEAKFGAKESQKLLSLAREFAKLLTPQRAATPRAAPTVSPPAASTPGAPPVVVAPPAAATSTVMIGPVSFVAPVPAAPMAEPVAPVAMPFVVAP